MNREAAAVTLSSDITIDQAVALLMVKHAAAPLVKRAGWWDNLLAGEAPGGDALSNAGWASARNGLIGAGIGGFAGGAHAAFGGKKKRVGEGAMQGALLGGALGAGGTALYHGGKHLASDPPSVTDLKAKADTEAAAAAAKQKELAGGTGFAQGREGGKSLVRNLKGLSPGGNPGRLPFQGLGGLAGAVEEAGGGSPGGVAGAVGGGYVGTRAGQSLNDLAYDRLRLGQLRAGDTALNAAELNTATAGAPEVVAPYKPGTPGEPAVAGSPESPARYNSKGNVKIPYKPEVSAKPEVPAKPGMASVGEHTRAVLDNQAAGFAPQEATSTFGQHFRNRLRGGAPITTSGIPGLTATGEPGVTEANMRRMSPRSGVVGKWRGARTAGMGLLGAGLGYGLGNKAQDYGAKGLDAVGHLFGY